jgi:hypothetical protein
MAREWELGTEGKTGTMDETLIEVFGCVSLNAMIARLDMGKDLALYRNGMDETLIEVFGCVSLDNRVVWLDTGRERKADRAGLMDHPVAARDVRLKVRYH